MASAPRSQGQVAEMPGAFVYLGRPPAPALARVLSRGPRQRRFRALRALGACWGLAVAAVFVPLLHFVLVPALLIAGPILAMVLHKEHATVLDARGPCPACDHTQTVALARPLAPRIEFRCEACGRALALETTLPATARG